LELYNVAGCRLDKKYLTCSHLQWHQGDSTLFEECREKTANRCRCNRLQQILPKSSISTAVPPDHIVNEGAVIFGKSSSTLNNFVSRPQAQASKILGIYSQKNVPLLAPIDRPVLRDQFLAEPPSTSEDDESPGDLSICTTASTQDSPETPKIAFPVPFTKCTQKRHRGDPHILFQDGECNENDDASHKRIKSHQEPTVCRKDDQSVQDPELENTSSIAVHLLQAKPERSLRRQNGFYEERKRV
jgi:hypothetical protein